MSMCAAYTNTALEAPQQRPNKAAPLQDSQPHDWQEQLDQLQASLSAREEENSQLWRQNAELRRDRAALRQLLSCGEQDLSAIRTTLARAYGAEPGPAASTALAAPAQPRSRKASLVRLCEAQFFSHQL